MFNDADVTTRLQNLAHPDTDNKIYTQFHKYTDTYSHTHVTYTRNTKTATKWCVK